MGVMKARLIRIRAGLKGFFASPKTRRVAKIALPVLAIMVLLSGFAFALATGDNSEASIYDAVINYDYTQGRSKDLEQKIERATSAQVEDEYGPLGAYNTTNQKKLFNAYLAKGEYYLNFGETQTALSAIRVAEQYAYEGEQSEQVLILYRDAYVQLGNLEQALYYENLLEGDFEAVFTDEELEALNALIEDETCPADESDESDGTEEDGE